MLGGRLRRRAAFRFGGSFLDDRASASGGHGKPGREYRGRGHQGGAGRSEEHTSELQSRLHLVCRLLLEKKNKPDSQAVIRPNSSPQSPYTQSSRHATSSSQ